MVRQQIANLSNVDSVVGVRVPVTAFRISKFLEAEACVRIRSRCNSLYVLMLFYTWCRVVYEYSC